MSDRLKYTLNGICHFENVPEQLAQNRFDIMRLDGTGYQGWCCQLRNHENFIYSTIWCELEYTGVKYGVRMLYNVLNRNSQSHIKMEKREIMTHDKVLVGPSIQVMDLLNQKNGFLNENGRLSIEYGIQVESIENGKMWEFNFMNEIIDKKNMITIYQAYGNYYCHRQLLSFHSECFDVTSEFRNLPDCIYRVLKIVHGERIYIDFFNCFDLIPFARQYKLLNVAKICEQTIIRNVNESYVVITTMSRIRQAIYWDFNRLLAETLRNAGSSSELLEVLKTSKVEYMSSEMMKMIIAICLYG